MGRLGFIVMLVGVLVEGGTGQPFLISKRLPDIFPALGHGVSAGTGASSSGGGLLSEVGVADSLGSLGHFIGVVAWLCCLD